MLHGGLIGGRIGILSADAIVARLVQFFSQLGAAGFEAITVEPTRVYRVEDAREFLTGKGVDVNAIAALVDGKFMSAFIRASKPRAMESESCTPACCS